MIIYRDITQGSDEWFDIKKGKMSASHATAIGNAGKGLLTYTMNVVLDIIVERDNYISKDMERGNELEPIARQVYEYENDVIVEQVGFIEYNKFVGCSPDGLIGDDGGLEIKARNNEKHLSLLVGESVDSSTIWQMNMSMLVSDRKWWDFVSYNPNFKQSLFQKRFYRDEKKINALLNGFEIGEKLIKELLKNKNIQNEII